MTVGLLIRNAEVDGECVDVRVTDERVARLGRDLPRQRGEEVLDADGGALLPGLHDHHIHLLALAAADSSVKVGPPAVRDRGGFVHALRRAASTVPLGRWIRAVGYHDRVVGDIDRWILDGVVCDTPLRVQHRSGALWVLNTAGIKAAGLDQIGHVDGIERNGAGDLTGRCWRLDSLLRERIRDAEPDLDLAGVSMRLLRYGVTGLTDATPTTSQESLHIIERAMIRGDVVQRVVATGGPSVPWEQMTRIERGPAKLLFPDHLLPSIDEMRTGVASARARGRAVAIHAVTSATLALAVVALDELGVVAGDRIEHGAVIPMGLAKRLAELDVSVVTNPGFIATRGDDYLIDVDQHELSDLWRCRSLLEHGVRVGAGTDAPFGDPNPWLSIAAAVDRSTDRGVPIGPEEALPPERAIDLFLSAQENPGGPPRRVVVGARADLCLLPVPRCEAHLDLRVVQPLATIVRGVAHRW